MCGLRAHLPKMKENFLHRCWVHCGGLAEAKKAQGDTSLKNYGLQLTDVVLDGFL
jgi:hypothetical protein